VYSASDRRKFTGHPQEVLFLTAQSPLNGPQMA
jgi:hypothetical protein